MDTSTYQIIKKQIDVTIHQLCYNEIKILEFSHNFWKSRFPKAKFILHDNGSTDGSCELAKRLGYEIRYFDTQNEADELVQTKIRNTCWKNDNSDWVIVADMDELIDITEKDLIRQEEAGKTIIKIKGYQMINIENKFDLQNNVYGFLDDRFKFDKNLIFNKKFIENMNWSVGSHSCNPYGVLVEYSDEEFNLLHYKYIGIGYVIEKFKELRMRQSKNNIKNQWGSKYFMEENDIIKMYNEFLDKKLYNLKNNNR